jgi:flagellar M-ring protein FliF
MAAVPAQAGDFGGQALPQKSNFLDGMVSLGILRQLALLIGLALSVAIGVGVVLWSQEGDYRPLYANLDKMDPSDVINTLQTNKINFKVDQASGALLVEADQIHDARLKLAGAGISPDGSFGFELLDKEQPLGTSQFMENARFKRGLEGELARTISSIRNVRSARVHLAIPKTSAFIRDARKPTASVFVDLFSGSGINSEQVRAIANMVAFSIPQLTVENVTVVDQRGNLLSNFSVDKDMAIANKQLEYVNQMETNLENRISSILEPVLGMDRFRTQVNANVDFTQVEQTDELFNPELPAVRSEQVVEESRGSGAAAGGVPGALSNQPPINSQAPEEVGAGVDAEGGVASSNGSSRRQSVKNYELDRTISHTRHQVGRLTRLSVAVLVDNMTSTDAETGETVSVALAQEDLDRLSILIKDAVGYDEARGDSVNIVNSAFMIKPAEEPVEMEDIPFWQQPEMFNYAKQLFGILFVLLLVFAVLIPAMRRLTDTSKEMRELEAQRAMGELAGDENSSETVTLSGGDSMLLTGPNENHEQKIHAIKGMVEEDPARVAQVVKKWVATGE